MTDKLLSYNPITQEVVGAVPLTSDDELKDVLERSKKGEKIWGTLSVSERAEILNGIRKDLVKRSDEFISTISNETGKPYWDSFVEVMTVAEHLKYMCRHAPVILSRQKRPTGILVHKRGYVQYFPHGTAGIISPWNYPLILAISPVVEALLAGNSVVLKPSEITPITGDKIHRLFLDGGVHESVFQIIQGYGDIGSKLVESPQTDVICFTGSVKVGKLISEHCAKQLKPSILELGGNDPMIILEDADIDRAVSAAIWGGLSNNGQTCIAVERIYVMESIADVFLELLKKRAKELNISADKKSADIGSMINQKQKEMVISFIDEAKKEGATFHLDYNQKTKNSSCFLYPTIIEEKNRKSKIMQSEIFGPVITVFRVNSEREAISEANSSGYGLSASVFSKNLRKGRKIAEQIKAGSVCINDVNSNYGCASLPFGGVGVSGIGRVRGEEGLKAFSRVQAVYEDRLGLKKEPWWFPVSDHTKKWFKRFFRYWYS